MITWLLLVSLFCKSMQDKSGRDNGVLHCGPQDLSLSSSNQMIVLTWRDDPDPSCSAVKHDVLLYELVVLMAGEQVHKEDVLVTDDQIGSTHLWNWTSTELDVTLCPSVRIRSQYNDYTSPWEEVIQSGVFPKDKIFKLGDTVTFCCALPAGEIFQRMYLNRHNTSDMTTTKITDQVYALTVNLTRASINSCSNVICETSQGRQRGACAYIGYPPQDRDLKCETRDLQSVECHWKTGEDMVVSRKSPTKYHLLGSLCPSESKGSCKKQVEVITGKRHWTLTAQNELGRVELIDTADLTERVHMQSPKELRVSNINARNVTLQWKWEVQRYRDLSITCQVTVSHDETHTTREYVDVGLHSAVLNDLLPNCTYSMAVRCGTTQHFWKWSDWSTSVNFHTKDDVPGALDVWRQLLDDKILIMWNDNQSHGHIEDYEVTWKQISGREHQKHKTIIHNKHRLNLSLDPTEEYIITVTARNMIGTSSPSAITIPSLSLDGTERVNTSWIVGSSGGFNLSWSASSTASCGYIVDWCRAVGKCKLQWLKVPPNQTSARIFSKSFSDGVRYSLSVYACTQGAPVLLERREGYVREEKITEDLFKKLNVKRWKSSEAEVSWGPIELREQPAFIHGYALYCLDNNNHTVKIASTDNPEATSLTTTNLGICSSVFILKALTEVGECGTKSFTAPLDPQTDNLAQILISLGAVFGLLCIIIILCYCNWTNIKDKVYPPIPQPVLTDEWFTSQGEGRFRPFPVDQCQHSEAEILDVPQLQCSSLPVENGYISKDIKPFVFTQTPTGYHNQPLKKNTLPPPLILPTTFTPSQPELPSSPFRSVFPNPSYNLVIPAEGQQPDSDPGPQEDMSLERSFSGYQPQSMNQTTPESRSPIDCDLTYVLLPKSA